MGGVDFDRPVVQRAVSLGIVVGLHVALVVALLVQSSTIAVFLPRAMQVQILQRPERPPEVPRIVPKLPPVTMEIPLPEIAVAPPPRQPAAPVSVARAAPHAAPVSHFGAAADDAGLGVGVAAQAGGGRAARGSLGDFDAAVKKAVLAHKVQPTLAWDRRNTCVINYSVVIARGGTLAGLHIDPCAVAEINQAAEAAIRAAAPFPPPPDLGAAQYTVHGTLIFRPEGG